MSGVNCNPKTALEEMTITKEQYGKTGGILGFHAFQSFAEGEVTPEQCHAIGISLFLIDNSIFFFLNIYINS